jgi:lysophospholipase L1-like esterase
MIASLKDSDSPQPRRWYLPVLAALLLATCTIAILAVLEGLTRIFFPQIGFVGESSALREPARFGTSIGYRPNASATSWGATVTTDALGFRHDPAEKPKPAKAPSIVIIGDSVPVGIGVEAQELFSSTLGRQLPQRIINTSVTNYGVEDYENIVRHFIVPKRSELSIEKVVLFVTFNDMAVPVEANAPPPAIQPPVEKPLHIRWAERLNQTVQFNAFLMQRSKLYLLLKGLAYDTSKSWFMSDARLFRNPSNVAVFAARMNAIKEMLQEAKIPLLVVVLPYEYQLRAPGTETLFPQSILRNILSTGKFDFVDLTAHFQEHLRRTGRRSSQLYLFNDHCHLSSMGHDVVAEALQPYLK